MFPPSYRTTNSAALRYYGGSTLALLEARFSARFLCRGKRPCASCASCSKDAPSSSLRDHRGEDFIKRLCDARHVFRIGCDVRSGTMRLQRDSRPLRLVVGTCSIFIPLQQLVLSLLSSKCLHILLAWTSLPKMPITPTGLSTTSGSASPVGSCDSFEA